MLAAIAYQESHWNANATSPTGVRGIMMLTKATVARMKIANRTDPEQSIKAGSEYLHMLISQVPDSVPKEDRIWYALTAYNMGLGHMLDARRLTKNLGGNPDNWLDVKKNLPLLAERRYYTNLKYGYARGYEAYQYVENIRRYMNSILNYYRVQQNQETMAEEKSEVTEKQAALIPTSTETVQTAETKQPQVENLPTKADNQTASVTDKVTNEKTAEQTPDENRQTGSEENVTIEPENKNIVNTETNTETVQPAAKELAAPAQ